MKTRRGQKFVIAGMRGYYRVSHSHAVVLNREYAKAVFEKTDKRHQEVADLRKIGKTLVEVGKMLGITKERVRQILIKEPRRFGIFAIDKENQETRICGFKTEQEAQAFAEKYLYVPTGEVSTPQ